MDVYLLDGPGDRVGGDFVCIFKSALRINTHQGVAHVRIRIPTGLDTDQKPGHLPEHYALYQNHPNPFNPSTTIRFEVPERSHVTLRIFDVLGKQVKVLVDREVEPGLHTVTWGGHAGDNSDVASGIYFYVMQAGEFVVRRKRCIDVSVQLCENKNIEPRINNELILTKPTI
ncbi:T9SS type A sorting domain-containing protein [candidate division KSB1 bacterium]|nr:T9SS type A sorting domain-containing protein [candidate division KSB1 bacterium]